MLTVPHTALLLASLLLAVGHSTAAPPAVTPSPDRDAIIQTIADFYIGDHTGSVEHKRRSMHPQGAFRFVDRAGERRLGGDPRPSTN